jgi:hypothetical protein
MNKPNIFTVIIILLSINLMLFASGVRVVESDDFVTRFIDIDAYQEENTTEFTEEFVGSVPTNYQSTGEGLGLTFIDTLQAVKDFLIFLVNIIFTPIGLFTQLPPIVGLLFGSFFVVAGVIAILYFIRSGN